jgi:hypothetical protein
MDGWMGLDGWMDGWMDGIGWVDGWEWMDGWISESVYILLIASFRRQNIIIDVTV